MLQWINRNNRRTGKTIAIFLMAVVFFVMLFGVSDALAQTTGGAVTADTLGDQYAGQIGLVGTDIRLIIANVIRIALGLVGLIMVIFMIYAGFLWMTAGGNDEQIIKAKSIIKNAVIGLAIILASYSIVLFVMNMLGIGATTFGEGEVGITGPNTQNFQGSGALGTVIKDHYPMRNQEDVSRNTKIVVTFRRPVKLSSFVDDTSGNGILGDCKETVANWSIDCDQLKKGANGQLSNSYVNISRVSQNGEVASLESFPSGIAVLATSTIMNGTSGIYTVVFRPNEFLGSTTEKFTYLVHLGNQILLDDPANRDPSVFSVRILGNDYYEWQFSCGTELDFNPPHVVSVYPQNGGQDYMNTALQVTFNEPMDPTGLEGSFVNGSNGSYYVLQGNAIFLKTDHSTLPAGNFSIVNNYQTLEFIPSRECGENTCGGKMYCMNVCDKDGGVGCTDVVIDSSSVKNELFKMVIKAATTNNANSFEASAHPFTGATDLSGNALDSAPLGAVNAAVIMDPTSPAFFGNNPDNYNWSFNLAQIMFTKEPVVRQVIPGLDAGEIKAKHDWKMDFEGVMLFNSLYDGISLREDPVQTPATCFAPRALTDAGGNTTLVNMFHCPFLDGRPMYYFPVLTSDLMEVHFNCFNPGKGPGDGTRANGAESALRALESSICDDAHPENCCAVDPTGRDPNSIVCCNGAVGADKNDASKCIDILKTTPPLP